ncbi:MAG: hypothetical protein K9W46_04515 [Candidatus Heimdallarchaeum endolithica]|uniref:Uncharacterized protein n=1 Tax=Candidatus Heimdallarchaeum endolithica TaxID=2876572 RepID=A0A9Y1BT21_9ARCH|nr:MAG: hypothetical protein K9W46_04515 [Candidatus Heimdallarchaeum endolithica]
MIDSLRCNIIRELSSFSSNTIELFGKRQIWLFLGEKASYIGFLSPNCDFSLTSNYSHSKIIQSEDLVSKINNSLITTVEKTIEEFVNEKCSILDEQIIFELIKIIRLKQSFRRIFC